MTSIQRQTLWGVDLGGTKIEGAILDPAKVTRASYRMRVPTESAKGYRHLLEQLSRLVDELEQKSGMKRPERIGVGTPGTMNPTTGLIKNSNTLCLNGKPLAQDLAQILGVEVVLANDANCCTLAEATLGAAKGKKTVFGIILGTGVGGGITVDGHLLIGAHGICGEWGHNPLRGEDAPCYCGRAGCIEMVCSGPALERFYAALSGNAVPLPEIASRAASGDPASVATMERLRDKFAEALGAVVNILDPDAIVIGGGVGNLDLLYTTEMRAAVQKHLFNDRFDTPLLRPALGDSAGVFGAAMLVT